MWHELVATLVTNRILDPLHYLRGERKEKQYCSASRYQQGVKQYQSKLYLNKLWSAFKQGVEVFRAHSQGFLSLGQWKKELSGTRMHVCHPVWQNYIFLNFVQR